MHLQLRRPGECDAEIRVLGVSDSNDCGKTDAGKTDSDDDNDDDCDDSGNAADVDCIIAGAAAAAVGYDHDYMMMV